MSSYFVSFLFASSLFTYCHTIPIAASPETPYFSLIDAIHRNRNATKDVVCPRADYSYSCGTYCVKGSSVCDGVLDCLDARDEVDCCESVCADTVSCFDGSCVHQDNLCNEEYDCSNGLDEIFCRKFLENNGLPSTMEPPNIEGCPDCQVKVGDNPLTCTRTEDTRCGRGNPFKFLEFLTGNGKISETTTTTPTTPTPPPTCTIPESSFTATCDNSIQVWVDGKKVDGSPVVENDDDWRFASEFKIDSGSQVLAVFCLDQGWQEGILGSNYNSAGREDWDSDTDEVLTGASGWVCSTEEQTNWETVDFDDSEWVTPDVVGAHGDDPWGIIDGIAEHAEWIWSGETNNDAGSEEKVWCRYKHVCSS